MASDNKDLMAQGSRVLPGLLPSFEAVALADRLLVNALPDDRGGIMLARLPTQAERASLQGRKDYLEKSIEPIGRGSTDHAGGANWARARQALSLLFGGYPSLRNSNVPEMLDIYLGWLADLPVGSIAEACRLVGTGQARWPDGKGGFESASMDFPPTHTRMHTLASLLADVDRKKLAAVYRVLRVTKQVPPDPSPEERERVRLLLEGLGKSLRGHVGTPADLRAEAQARLDAAAAEVRAIEAGRAGKSVGAE